MSDLEQELTELTPEELESKADLQASVEEDNYQEKDY